MPRKRDLEDEDVHQPRWFSRIKPTDSMRFGNHLKRGAIGLTFN